MEIGRTVFFEPALDIRSLSLKFHVPQQNATILPKSCSEVDHDLQIQIRKEK